MDGGVGHKIQAHLRLWCELGHEARLFLHTPDELALPQTQTFRFQPGTRLPLLRSLAREAARSSALADLITAVEQYRPDAVYLRYGLYALPLSRIFKAAPVFVEINSKDVPEYRMRGPVFYHTNRLTRRLILGPAAGFLPVSRELAELPENRRFAKPYLVLANGIDLGAVEPLPAPRNPAPRLVIVGSPGYSWHGMDKLFAFAHRFPDLSIDVVGYQPEDFAQPAPANMRFHGFVAGEALGNILAQADAAFGTLALHRKDMQESSPLKVREALAHGIPLVIAYHDTDLSGKGFDFVLEMPNTEDNLLEYGERVRQFAYAMQGRRVDRTVVAPLIDQRIKEQARLGFMRQVLLQSGRGPEAER
jgi:glycosyltransferase involved in cell wall biosynthesis